METSAAKEPCLPTTLAVRALLNQLENEAYAVLMFDCSADTYKKIRTCLRAAQMCLRGIPVEIKNARRGAAVEAKDEDDCRYPWCWSEEEEFCVLCDNGNGNGGGSDE